MYTIYITISIGLVLKVEVLCIFIVSAALKCFVSLPSPPISFKIDPKAFQRGELSCGFRRGFCLVFKIEYIVSIYFFGFLLFREWFHVLENFPLHL